MNMSWVSYPDSGHTHLNLGLLTPAQGSFLYAPISEAALETHMTLYLLRLYGNIFKYFDEVLETESKSMSNEDHRKGKG